MENASDNRPLSGLVFYFDIEDDVEPLNDKVHELGGIVAPRFFINKITHLVYQRGDHFRLNKVRLDGKISVVGVDYIEACFEEKKRLPESDYKLQPKDEKKKRKRKEKKAENESELKKSKDESNAHSKVEEEKVKNESEANKENDGNNQLMNLASTAPSNSTNLKNECKKVKPTLHEMWVCKHCLENNFDSLSSMCRCCSKLRTYSPEKKAETQADSAHAVNICISLDDDDEGNDNLCFKQSNKTFEKKSRNVFRILSSQDDSEKDKKQAPSNDRALAVADKKSQRLSLDNENVVENECMNKSKDLHPVMEIGNENEEGCVKAVKSTKSSESEKSSSNESNNTFQEKKGKVDSLEEYDCDNYRIALSGFSTDIRLQLTSIVEEIQGENGEGVVTDDSGKYTHLVVPEKDPKRTLKVLFALNRGAKIVTPQWLYDSLANKKFSDPSKFSSKCFKSKNKKLRLLKGKKVYIPFMNDSKIPPHDVLSNLLRESKAKVCNNIKHANMCLASEKYINSVASEAIAKIVGRENLVTWSWFADSIEKGELQD